MTDPTVFLALAAVTAVAAAVQGVAGFGFGLLAATGYMWLIGPADAVPLVMLVNFAMSGFLAYRVRAHVDQGLAPGLGIGCLIGLPAGVWAAGSMDTDGLLVGVGANLVAFTAFLALQDRFAKGAWEHRVSNLWAWPAGFLGGGLTTAVGMPGPPVLALLTLRRAGRTRLRATSLGFFGLSYSAGLAVHQVMVGVSRDVWLYGWILIGVAFGAGLVGAGIASKVEERPFRTGVLLLLALVGVASIVRGAIGG